ncbi:MAG TPA: PEP-CTERM sorting domain-containing protein [Planctomycetota bacterium]|nr:PEP-CTERM sorting domain-containing protein [Planctomycetota bacterium]
MRLLSLTACLAVSSAAFAIDPVSSFTSAGPVQAADANATFLAAVNYFDTNPVAGYYSPSGAAEGDTTATAGMLFGNPSGLTLNAGSGLRVWFVSQNAGYRNGFGLTTDNDGVPGPSQTQLVFNNSHALTQGQYVDINGGGTVNGGISFFALTNISGDSAQNQWFDTNGPANADGQSHINLGSVPFVSAGSLWYALAIDDQFKGPGTDRDWNDLRLLLEVRPVAAPEPGTIALFLGFLGVAAWMWRRQQLVAA